MKTRKVLGIIFLLCSLLLVIFGMTGCESKTVETGGYQIYYTNTARTMLLSAGYNVKGSDDLEIIQELFQKMKDPGVSSEQLSLVPEQLEVVKWDLTDGQLTATFSSEYMLMDNVSEVLFRAGFVETMTQISDVKKVVFHIGNEVLKNSAGEPVGAMTRSSFINNPVGINSYQFVALDLYFPNSTGDTVVKEMRNLHYSTNTTLPKVVMEQLMKGPMNKGLRSIFTEDAKVLDIKVMDKTCSVNFNEAFLTAGDKLTIKPEAVIYSIVNSLCDVLGTEKVQFSIEGNSDVLYAGELSFNGPFHRNSSLIATQDSVVNTENIVPSETEVEEPILGEPQIGL